MENLKTITKFNEGSKNTRTIVKGFKNFDKTNELKDYDLSKEEILNKRLEISNKISTIETELNNNKVEDLNIDVENYELELESLKKEYNKIQLLAEQKIFTHKSIVKIK